MKKTFFLLILMSGLISANLNATTGRQDKKRLSPETFRAHRQAFITQKAELTKEEAAAFFPVYFELQDKKKELNDKAWKRMHDLKDEKSTEADYKKALSEMYDTRIAIDQLEKSYFEKYKKILPYKKIYLIQKAEMNFHRELFKGFKGGTFTPPGEFMKKKGESYRRNPQYIKHKKSKETKEPKESKEKTETSVNTSTGA